MRSSNLKVREWLLAHGFDDIWFKAHGNRSDMVFTQRGNYLATDLWNLFDGICFHPDGTVRFLQMKTNAWPKKDPIIDFLKKTKGLAVMVFNVTNSRSREYEVRVRCYP